MKVALNTIIPPFPLDVFLLIAPFYTVSRRLDYKLIINTFFVPTFQHLNMFRIVSAFNAFNRTLVNEGVYACKMCLGFPHTLSLFRLNMLYRCLHIEHD